MDRVLSSHLFLTQRLRPAHLDLLAECGAGGVEIFCAGQHFDYTQRADIAEMRKYFASTPLKLHSLHGPMYAGADMGRAGAPLVNVVHPERSSRIAAMDELKRGLEVAEQIPFRFFVLHLDGRDQPWDEKVLEHAITAIEHLRAFARPLGVQLALENLINEITLPQFLREILNVGHFDDVGICLDTGHANVIARRRSLERSRQVDRNGAQSAAREDVVAAFLADVERLLPRIVTTHLHDNDGTRDAHLMPGAEAAGDGGVPWTELMPLLKSAPLAPVANTELHTDNAAPVETLPQRIRSAWEQLGV